MKKALLFLYLVSILGCGYTTRGFQYEGDSIIIEPVVNKINITNETRKYSNYKSYPILIENKLTNELVNKFNNDGGLKVTSVDPQALVLTCLVVDYDKDSLSYDDDDGIEEQRLRLKVKVTLANPDGELLIVRTVTGESTYYLEGAKAISETAAQVELIDDAARRILELVVEDW